MKYLFFFTLVLSIFSISAKSQASVCATKNTRSNISNGVTIGGDFTYEFDAPEGAVVSATESSAEYSNTVQPEQIQYHAITGRWRIRTSGGPTLVLHAVVDGVSYKADASLYQSMPCQIVPEEGYYTAALGCSIGVGSPKTIGGLLTEFSILDSQSYHLSCLTGSDAGHGPGVTVTGCNEIDANHCSLDLYGNGTLQVQIISPTRFSVGGRVFNCEQSSANRSFCGNSRQ